MDGFGIRNGVKVIPKNGRCISAGLTLEAALGQIWTP